MGHRRRTAAAAYKRARFGAGSATLALAEIDGVTLSVGGIALVPERR